MSGDSPSASNESKAGSSRGQWILTWLILAGLVLGAVAGQLAYWGFGGEVPAGLLEAFKFVGDTFFMNLLKMILVPLVASSVVVGVASIGDPSELGKVGGMTILYYFATMVLAVLLGVLLVTSFAPGDPNGDGSGIGAAVIARGESEYAGEAEEKRQRIEEKARAGEQGVAGALWASFQNLARQVIPSNPIGAAAEGQLLPVIAFSLIIGVVLTVVGPRGQPLFNVFDALFAVIMRLVDWILWLAPLGVFCLVA